MGPNLMDENDCGNLFDQIDDLIEFPPENDSGVGKFVNAGAKDFPSMWNDALPEKDPFFASDLSAQLCVPYEDMEWASTFSSGGGKEKISSPVCSSSSSCSHRGAPSKRPRPGTFNPRAAIQLISPQQNKKKKQESNQQSIRKCLHCEITKTPQWRAGPMGPKSLCNACGVRYKSGRLFPEYRPAASPTFVPSLHSNSHKKVMEMRTKTCPSTTHPHPP